MRKKLSAINEVHDFVKNHVSQADICIDATAGNGHDTAFLCSLVGENGKVYAFDIQEKAVISTTKRINELKYNQMCEIIHDGHENMNKYVQLNSVQCIMFNFGYLPSGDHNICTKPQSSIEAIEQGLELLKESGVISLCIYSGGDSGYEERDALLLFLKSLDYRKYTVIMHDFFNRPNDPPIPIFIYKGV